MKLINILYVEDNDRLRDSIGEILASDGRKVYACASAEAALVALESNHFDVLVSDISLPGMSGTDLARYVLRSHPNFWVILCSGYDVNFGLKQLGPNVRALLKPFTVVELEGLLNEIAIALTEIA